MPVVLPWSEEQRHVRVLHGERGVLADGLGVDLEVEIDADRLVEVIAQGDEPDFDRDLEVLEPAELAEQVGDLVVDLRRVADDQADAEVERRDRADRLGGVEAAGVAAEPASHAVGPRVVAPRWRRGPARSPGAIVAVISEISGVRSTCGRSLTTAPGTAAGLGAAGGHRRHAVGHRDGLRRDLTRVRR